ncbi:hypothetical protein DFH09DRAFT_1424189 [Mycena vulgaris]|nr:hypothetical protein DFH09DRAFT_1424189 [Mycena vulgaris]
MAPSLPSAHSQRNPRKPIIPARRRQTQSQASRASKELEAALRKERQMRLDDDIDAFYALRAQRITEIAQDHGKSEKAIRAIISNTTQYKASRAPNLRNAIIHDRAVKAKEAGDHPKALTDLQMELEDAIEDGDVETAAEKMSPEEKIRLIDQLTEWRELHRRGARSTNKAAAMDGLQTANGVRDAILDLYERTGIRAFAVFSRGNPDDTALPHCVDSDDALAFFTQVLDMPEVDVLRKFEQWSCTLDNGPRERNDGSTMRKLIVQLVLDGLRKITKMKTATMSYEHYDVDIRQALKVEIAGWPIDIPMVSPGKITSVESLRALRDKLRSGAIHWVCMTKSQLTELDKELDERRNAKGGTLKKRAERSDKGKKRGPRRNTAGADEEEEEEEDATAPVAAPVATTPAAAAGFSTSVPASTAAPVITTSTAAPPISVTVPAAVAHAATHTSVFAVSTTVNAGAAKPRKKRSDAGKKRKSADLEASTENTPPAKRRKQGQSERGTKRKLTDAGATVATAAKRARKAAP